MLTGIKDVDLKILLYLNDKDLLNFWLANPRDKSLCNNESFWKNKFYSKYPDFIGKISKKVYLQLIYYDNKYTANKASEILSEGGMKNIDLITYFISKTNKSYEILENCLLGAAKSGDKDLINIFFKKGTLYEGLIHKGLFGAAEGGHKDLVYFFIDEMIKKK